MKPTSKIQKHRKILEYFLFIFDSSPKENINHERALREAIEIMQESATIIKTLEKENEEMQEQLRKYRGDFYASIRPEVINN